VKEKTTIKLWAMSLIAGLEAVNIAVFHVDGAVFGGVIAAIAGLAGYSIGKERGEK
jgi:hypothetical protein